MSPVDVKCASCRSVLTKVQCATRQTDLISLPDDDLPQWADQAVQESGWTKGKLHCPQCQHRVGGFDFVGQAGVDVAVPISSEIGLQSRIHQPEASNSEGPPSPPIAQTESERQAPISMSNLNRGACWYPFVLTNTTNYKMRTSRRRRPRPTRGRLSHHQAMILFEQPKKNDLIALLDDLEEFNEDYQCPVCMDILFEPFAVNPCQHVFCGPCLRRIERKHVFTSQCPMCRVYIEYCVAKDDLFDQIETEYPGLVSKRRKFEHESKIYRVELPWRPSLWNIIKARSSRNKNYLRHLFNGLPLHITPILLNTFVKLTFFVFFLWFLEILPLFYGISVTRGGRNGVSKIFSKAHHQAFQFVSENTFTVNGMCYIPSDLSLFEELIGNMTGNDYLIQKQKICPNSNAMRGMAGPVIDATFYYVLVVLSLGAAVFGNLILVLMCLTEVHHHPLIPVPGSDLMHRLIRSNRDNNNPNELMQSLTFRIFDCMLFFLMLALPVLGIPVLCDIQYLDIESRGLISMIPGVAEIFLVKGPFSLLTVVLGLSAVVSTLWVGTVYLDFVSI